MIARLFEYFTIGGILSILAWIAALVLLLGFYRDRRRTTVYWIALGIMALAMGLGELNSRSIAAIRVDRSAEEEAMRERQREVRQEEYQRMLQQTSGIRFAEDAPGDELDPAGMRSDRQMGVYEQAARGMADEPAYRQGGPRERVVDGENQGIVGSSEGEPTTEGFTTEEPRMLVESALLEAQRWDRANRFALQALFLLSLGAVLADYLYRFNCTSQPYAPLPISGPLVDHLLPKNSLSPAEMMLREQGKKTYSETVLRKGETFCLFSPEDPWPDEDALSRWPEWVEKAGLFNTRIPKQTFPGLPGGDEEYILESLWFNRACFCLTTPFQQPDWAETFEQFLLYRVRTQARARQTIHFIFTGIQPPAPETLARWRRLGAETNAFVLFLPAHESANP